MINGMHLDLSGYKDITAIIFIAAVIDAVHYIKSMASTHACVWLICGEVYHRDHSKISSK